MIKYGNSLVCESEEKIPFQNAFHHVNAFFRIRKMRDRHLFGKVNWFGYHLQILDADTIFELVDKQVSIFTGDKHTITSSSNRNDLIPWHGHNLDHVKYLDGHTSKAILWMKSGKWSENWNSKGSWKDGKWWKAMQEEWKLGKLGWVMCEMCMQVEQGRDEREWS